MLSKLPPQVCKGGGGGGGGGRNRLGKQRRGEQQQQAVEFPQVLTSTIIIAELNLNQNLINTLRPAIFVLHS